MPAVRVSDLARIAVDDVDIEARKISRRAGIPRGRVRWCDRETSDERPTVGQAARTNEVCTHPRILKPRIHLENGFFEPDSTHKDPRSDLFLTPF